MLVTRAKHPSLPSNRKEPQEDRILDDQALVAAIARQEQEAFERLYDRYHTMVYHLARKILNTPDRAEEVVYDVFWQVWREASRYDEQRGSVGAWVTTLARSRAIDALRARQAQPATSDDATTDEHALLTDPTPNPEERSSLGQRASLVRAALDTLPTDQRTALELAFFRGFSHSEIAEQLDEPIGTIKTRIRTAMLRVRDRLRPILSGKP
jgi:RNA polymerase sigma-70 factor (ECF subfamily)